MEHDKEKQKRMVCHLEYQGQHYYFGNLKVLTDNFSREQLGVGYKSLANHFTKHSEFFNGARLMRKRQIFTLTKLKKGLDKWKYR